MEREILNGKTGSIEQADLDFAAEVVEQFPDCFYGGSFVALGASKAHDIDVVVPHRIWKDVRRYLSGRIFKVLKDIPTEVEDVGEPGDDRLITVYRRGNVDLLVIRDEYVVAYRNAVRDMTERPEDFQEREQRVAVHIRYADEVRAELGEPSEAEQRESFWRKRSFSTREGGEYSGR